MQSEVLGSNPVASSASGGASARREPAERSSAAPTNSQAMQYGSARATLLDDSSADLRTAARRLPWAFVFLLPGLVGCPKPAPPLPAPPVATTIVQEQEHVQEKEPPPTEVPSAPDTNAATDPLTNSPSISEPAAAPSESAVSPVKAATQEPGRERLVLLLPGGPIVVDLNITIDERPLGESLDEALARLMLEADGDKDGRVTWDEITRQPAFQRGLYGNQPVGADNDRRQVIQRYDWNRDKVVSRDELLRWLVREPHRAKPLVLDSMISSREGSRADSPLLRSLDTDGNGKLDASELAAASQRLNSRDTDEDEIIDPADLLMSTSTPSDPSMSRGEPSAPAVVLLGEKTDWANFQRTMQDTYSLGGPLGPEAWLSAAELFHELDLNHDNLIGRSEWATLRSVDAHLTLDGKIGATGDKLILRHASPKVKERLVSNLPANTLRLELPSGRLELILSPVPLPDYAAQAQAVIAMSDGDKNNYLEESEAAQALAGTGGTFADIDTNGDAKIYADEIVAALRKRQSITMEQVRVQAGYRADAWWQVADADGDGRLDGTEIDSLAARLQKLDRDQDDIVDRDEVPVTFVLGLSRGGQAGAPGALPAPLGMIVESAKLPAWFDQMDANGDGRIGRREFLGSAELFAKLDRNGDGRLEWSELRDYGQQAKPEAADLAPKGEPSNP